MRSVEPDMRESGPDAIESCMFLMRNERERPFAFSGQIVLSCGNSKPNRLGVAPWADGDIVIRMVPVQLQIYFLHVKGHEQERCFSRQTAPAQNRGSTCDNQHAR
jgi:hypothetical protein